MRIEAQHDEAGNVLNDGANQYLYDADGRVCAVQSTLEPGYTTLTGYVYDAEGNRVAKGTIASGTITSIGCDPTAWVGFQFTENYVLGPGGEELTMLDGQGNWQRTNVYAGGKLIGTYDLVNNAPALHFHLGDGLGTRRMEVSGMLANLGQPEMDFQSLPYGDQFAAFPDPNADQSSNDDSTPLHFTGKERDTESGNDYFGARYYASTMGRFLSPDPLNPARSSQKVLAQFLDDPQNWNKYSYGLNNPVRYTDTTGNFTSKDHTAMEMAALKGLGYSDQAARIAARADARMDNFHNMASGVPFLHHFVETSENPQHGEREDHSDIATAKGQAENFMAGKELFAAWKALAGVTDQALEALGEASHTAQDIVRHQFEEAKDHPLGEAPATDEETKAAVAATQQVEKDFETTLTTMGHEQGMTNAQIQTVLDRVKKGQNGNN